MTGETSKTYQLQCMVLIRFNKQTAKISYKIMLKTLNTDWIINDVEKLFSFQSIIMVLSYTYIFKSDILEKYTQLFMK